MACGVPLQSRLPPKVISTDGCRLPCEGDDYPVELPFIEDEQIAMFDDTRV